MDTRGIVVGVADGKVARHQTVGSDDYAIPQVADSTATVYHALIPRLDALTAISRRGAILDANPADRSVDASG